MRPAHARRTQKRETHGYAPKARVAREYSVWLNMRRRCEDPESKSYRIYGARGIMVCERWSLFTNFLADMGPRSSGSSIDRIDSDGNYEPSNCRWATRLEQSRNSSRAKLSMEAAVEIRALRAAGTRTVDIASKYGVHKATIERVLNGQRWLADATLRATEGAK